jgi:hypothetical protein
MEEKSPITEATPRGAFAVSSWLRYKARKGTAALRNSSTTAPPAFPDAPVTRIMLSSFAISAVWYNGDEGSCKYAQIGKPEERVIK